MNIDNLKLFPHGTERKIFADPNDCATLTIQKHGMCEKIACQFLQTLLIKLEHPVVFDIGANIGNHVLALSSYCEKIYAFEPQEIANAILRKNVTVHGFMWLNYKEIFFWFGCFMLKFDNFRYMPRNQVFVL
jgi:hypothetical protein